jgi:predicted DNA binding CopG/RHH family protein
MNINKIKLNEKDENKLQESLRMVEKLPFVERIEFEEKDSVVLVRLSDMDIQTIKRIHEIEYDLLEDFDEDLNFIVSPI